MYYLTNKITRYEINPHVYPSNTYNYAKYRNSLLYYHLVEMDLRNVSLKGPNDNFIVDLSIDDHLQNIKMYPIRIKLI